MLFNRSNLYIHFILLLLTRTLAASPVEVDSAIKALQESAEAGNPVAQYRLAQEYFQGRYLPKNNQLGLKWIRKAAESGNSAAQIGMGVLYHYGEDIVGLDYNKAMSWYQKAADSYEALAYTYIGILYRDGLGVDKDLPRALQWITRGAENGDAFGQVVLGRMYLDGDGVPQDDKEATRWLTMSANNGNRLGAYNLAKLYESNADMEKATYWYRQAAARGLPEAQQYLEENVTTSNPLRDALPGSYILQLMAVKKPETAARFNQEHMIGGQVWRYQTKDATWYLLVKGIFSSKEAARQAQTALPALPEGTTPWLRPVDKALKKEGAIDVVR